MLDNDLASLYGVLTFRLNRDVKRNIGRFPADFMFQLTPAESDVLRSQIGISNKGRGGRRYLPYAFTEQGVSMLSSVLNSERAIQVNIAIMRVFSRLKETLVRRQDLAATLGELEERVDSHDTKIIAIFNAIKQLIDPKKRRPRIGFVPKT
jgi:ORF6N domain